jgi:transcription antitermination factor NusG
MGKLEVGNNVMITMGYYNGEKGIVKKIDKYGIIVTLYTGVTEVFGRLEIRKL